MSKIRSHQLVVFESMGLINWEYSTFRVDWVCCLFRIVSFRNINYKSLKTKDENLNCCCAHSLNRLAIKISAPFDVVQIFGFGANDFRNFLVQKEPRERQRRFKSEILSVPSNCYEKDRGWQSCWVGIWRQPKIGEGYMILPLFTHERNLVLGADAQRFSWPSYTAVVHTIGYLRFFFWGGKTRCAFDCNT
jgi:hypothetical protein